MIVLLITTVVLWIVVAASWLQRLYAMPRWFENPPASFERIRRQSKASRIFWLPIMALSLISSIASLIMNWGYPDIRTYMLIALACFVLNGVSTGLYFVKEILIFARMPADAPQTPALLTRTKTWLKWTTLRNVLQVFSAVFATMAYLHFIK